MRNQKLQCLIIGKSLVFVNLLKSLNRLDTKIHLRQSPNIKKNIIASLLAMKGPSIVFVSDDASFPLKQLSSLLMRNKPNAIVIIVTTKTVSTSLKKPFDNIQFAKLNVRNDNIKVQVLLNNYAYITKCKQQFKKCKSLLGNAEKRNFWLVESSYEAIAFLSKDKLLYANTPFLALFDIDPLNNLSEINFRNFIVDDEVSIFNGFMKYQFRHQKSSHNLLLSMKNDSSREFRAKIYATPAVFKGKFCWQLWVKEIIEVSSDTEGEKSVIGGDLNRVKNTHISNEKNPFAELSKELSEKKKKADSELVLKGILNRNEVSISAQKLVSLQPNITKSYFALSLKVPAAQKKGVNELLFGSSELGGNYKRDIFWDKAKVLRLIQILVKKKSPSHKYLINLSISSISNTEFSQWLIKSLSLLGQQTRNLVFVFSPGSRLVDYHQVALLINSLKEMDCEIAIDEFTTDKISLDLLKLVKPNFVNLSSKWVQSVESNERKEIALASLIRQFEERDIKVIVPFGFSQKMKKIFVFSGASFCQERSTIIG